MDLRQIVDSLGMSQIALARAAGIDRFVLYSILHGDRALKPEEEKALTAALLDRAAKAEEAIRILRSQVAHA